MLLDSTHAPQVGVMEVERQVCVDLAVHKLFAGNGPRCSANLVGECDVFVTGAIGNNIRTSGSEGAEFVDHDRLEGVVNRLKGDS